jgi:hypothetical protein
MSKLFCLSEVGAGTGIGWNQSHQLRRQTSFKPFFQLGQAASEKTLNDELFKFRAFAISEISFRTGQIAQGYSLLSFLQSHKTQNS